jgi:SEC-C motif-containing protein
VRGERRPETAEALMRSRYAAYTMEAVDYIVDSHHPDGRGEIDRDGAAQWAREAEWLGLEVVDTTAGGVGDERGEVEFIARYKMSGGEFAHHERATFQRVDGRWFYVDGEMVKAKPVVREAPRVGRNDPCPCGSGKKFKRCCG